MTGNVQIDSLDEFALSKLQTMERNNSRRHLIVTDRSGPIEVIRDGKRYISFSCNDYLNLSQHDKIKEAAIAGIERYGVGSGASRLVTGNHPQFDQLEKKLAKFKGTESAVVFGSGYLANAGVIPTLIMKTDIVFSDELSHSCIHMGCQLSAGSSFSYHHNDLDHLEKLLLQHRDQHQRALIVTDGVFSMDGDLAPVGELRDLADAHDAWLMTDDAHGIGVVGLGARGSSHVDLSSRKPHLQMGTLSKAIGGYGGYLCASKAVIDLIKTKCRTLIYSTGLPPSMVAAAIASLDFIEANPAYAAKPLTKAQLFTSCLGLPEATSPIVPVVLGATDITMKAAEILSEAGFLVVPIRPPTVPKGTGRLRFTFTAEHRDEDIIRLADLVRAKIMQEDALSKVGS
jgi:8-amino-7-oxononanoate synthase